jgi:hypothetical protein
MRTKRELTAEIAKLRKLLKERDALLMQAAIKFEDITGTMDVWLTRRMD